jgi:outer membrane protein OmpA-like peptidoglycan-associated protein
VRGGALSFFIAGAIAFGQQVSFVSCPIVRDTKVAPCFLAEYDGETYFLGSQLDAANGFRLPQLKHDVLVEGRVAPGPRVCGGIPLEPVAISVMKEVNLACNVLLPPEAGLEAPTAARQAPIRLSDARTGRKEFIILFEFDDDSLDAEGTLALTESAAYAKRTKASSVRVTGYRATALLSNGERLIEAAGLAEKRAQNAATLLRGFGLSGVTVDSKQEAEPADGKTDPSRRHVTIVVIP